MICSFMDSSGEASGPIKRCLFIGYIINIFIEYFWFELFNIFSVMLGCVFLG